MRECLPAGLAALLDLDVETSYHAVQAIAQFAADERYRSLLPEIGAMAPLAALVASHLPHVQKCALSAVANSSFVPTAAGPLCASGALTQLGQLLFSTDAETQKMCLTTLCNLLGAQAGAAPPSGPSTRRPSASTGASFAVLFTRGRLPKLFHGALTLPILIMARRVGLRARL